MTLWDTWAPLTRLRLLINLSILVFQRRKGKKQKQKSFAPGWLRLYRLPHSSASKELASLHSGRTRKAGLWETLYKSKQLCLMYFITSILSCSLVLNMVGFSPPAACPSWKHPIRGWFLHMPVHTILHSPTSMLQWKGTGCPVCFGWEQI